MNVTGNSFRSIEAVPELSFSKKIKLSSTSGAFKFGFSGESTGLSFTFESGKVYDPENRIVFGYNDINSLTLSGSIATGSYSYYINGKKVCTNGSKSNFLINKAFYEANGSSATVNNFYIKTDSDNCTKLYLNVPQSTFKVGQPTTGYIVNSGAAGSATKIFAGSVNNFTNFGLSGFPFTVQDSGQFVITNSSSSLDFYNLEITFNTSSGDFDTNKSLTRSSSSDVSYNYLSGEGTISNTIGDVTEDLTLQSIVSYGENPKHFELPIISQRYSGTSNIKVSKSLSYFFDLNLTEGGNPVELRTGTSYSNLSLDTFRYRGVGSDYHEFFSGQIELSSSQDNFIFEIRNPAVGFSSKNTGTMFYNITGETVVISGALSLT